MPHRVYLHENGQRCRVPSLYNVAIQCNLGKLNFCSPALHCVGKLQFMCGNTNMGQHSCRATSKVLIKFHRWNQDCWPLNYWDLFKPLRSLLFRTHYQLVMYILPYPWHFCCFTYFSRQPASLLHLGDRRRDGGKFFPLCSRLTPTPISSNFWGSVIIYMIIIQWTVYRLD